MLVIPSIDIYEGSCVRLTQGEFSQKTIYDCDPCEQAERFGHAGAKYLHVVDLEGAKNAKVANWKSMEKILSVVNIDVQVGGGVRTEEDIKKLLAMGADRVVIGSIAVKEPTLLEEWVKIFGADNFCIALDVKNGNVFSEGWQRGETVTLKDTVERIVSYGIKNFLSTDIERDGMLAGSNFELYRELVKLFPSCSWLASGGVSSSNDLTRLAEIGVKGAIVGKAFYEGKLSLKEVLSQAW